MSQVKVKKLRKEVRKEAKRCYGEGIAVLNTLIRKRPKNFPKFLWILLYIPLFKKKCIKSLYKNI